jgi:predicted kinase
MHGSRPSQGCGGLPLPLAGTVMRTLGEKNMSIPGKLIFMCGKMAAGKSTLARELAEQENAVLLVQDELLDSLFPGEITDIPGFVKCSSRLKNALGPHICALLSKGISVVLDFPGNTRAQRAWFRELFERANAEHELNYVDASDALCKRQLKERSEDLSAGTPWATDAEFEAITVYFQPPSEEERFNVVRHERA